MASGPINSWQIEGKTMEAVQILFSWGSESLWMVTAALKFKRPLLLGKKAMTNLDSILKSRDITLPIHDFAGGSDSKESACNVVDLGLILGLGRSPGRGNGNTLQYSCLENPLVRGAWWATVLAVTKNQT